MDFQILALSICIGKCDHTVCAKSCIIKTDIDLRLCITAFFAGWICAKTAIAMKTVKATAVLVKTACKAALFTAAEHISENITKDIIAFSAFKMEGVSV